MSVLETMSGMNGLRRCICRIRAFVWWQRDSHSWGCIGLV